jgi:hypothetical protein
MRQRYLLRSFVVAELNNKQQPLFLRARLHFAWFGPTFMLKDDICACSDCYNVLLAALFDWPLMLFKFHSRFVPLSHSPLWHVYRTGCPVQCSAAPLLVSTPQVTLPL